MADNWLSESHCIYLLGEERAKALLQQFGGNELYIPARLAKDHPIAQAIGLIGMACLCREFGGCRIDLPNASRKEGKKVRIMELIDQGLGSPEIARITGVTARYVRLVKKDYIRSATAS